MATIQLPVIMIVAALILVAAEERVWLPRSNVLLVIVVSLAVAAGLLRYRPWVTRLAAFIVILALFADTPGQPAWNRLEHDSARASASRTVETYVETTGAARWLKERRDAGEIFRYFGYDLAALTIPNERATYAVGHYRPGTALLLINNRGISLDLDDVQGYNPVQIRRYVTYFRHLNDQSQSYHTSNVLENGLDSPLLNQLNARYIVLPAVIPANRPDLFHATQRYPTVYLDASNRILENPDALPRAWIVHDAVRTRTGQILPQYIDGTVDPATTALMDTNPPDLEPAPGEATESIEFVHRENDEIRLRVDAASRGLVVLSEIWDPGWTATVDGVDARVYRTNFMFRGVVVDAGVHEIVLRFPANDVKWTFAFYLIPLVAFGGLAVAWLWTRRRPPPALPAAWPERPTATRTGHWPRFSDGSDLPPWSGESRSQPR